MWEASASDSALVGGCPRKNCEPAVGWLLCSVSGFRLRGLGFGFRGFLGFGVLGFRL